MTADPEQASIDSTFCAFALYSLKIFRCIYTDPLRLRPS
jgi:hypothetical protein